MEHRTQATELGCAPDRILCCPSARAEAWAGEETGLLPVCVFPESPGCCGRIPGAPLLPGAVGRPLGVSGVGCWAFLPQGPGLLQLQGAALAECPPECEVLPQGGPGKSPARRLLWSASRRRPSFGAHPPGPPGSGLGSPSSWDRKPHISLELGVGRGREADPAGWGHQLSGLTLVCCPAGPPDTCQSPETVLPSV